jgi:chemotaxis protein MotB
MNERILDLTQSLEDWERRNRTRTLGLVLIPLAVAGGLGWYAQARFERAEAGRDEAVRQALAAATAQTSRAQENAAATAASLRAELETARHSLQQQTARADSLETEFGRARQERDLALAEREAAARQAAETAARVVALQAELDAARAGTTEVAPAAALVPLPLDDQAEPAADPLEVVRAGMAEASGVEVLDDGRLVLGATLLFPSGQAELSLEGREGLRVVADRLKTALATLAPGTAWTLHVEGHTDDTPVRHSGFASNQALSEARAQAVAAYLAAQGLPADRLVAAGYAATRPLATGSSDAARGRNRRIELRLGAS